MKYNDREWQLFCAVYGGEIAYGRAKIVALASARENVEVARKGRLTEMSEVVDKSQRPTNDTYNVHEFEMLCDAYSDLLKKGKCKSSALEISQKYVELYRVLGITEAQNYYRTNVVETESALQDLQRMGQECDAESVVDNKTENIIDKPSCQSQDIGKTIICVSEKRIDFIDSCNCKYNIIIDTKNSIRFVDEEYYAQLSQQNVRDLLPYLQNFEKYGNFIGKV
jgi:hypothetical protein